jgi:anti-sigma regulatory factor (Ser/Thr protein kinase)
VRVSRSERFILAADKRAVREARLHVRAFGELPTETRADAELVVSELVANSVLHAHLRPDDVIELTIRCDVDRLSIEVADSGGFSGRPRVRRGLGFKVLDAVCEDWHAENGRVSASIAIRRGGDSTPTQRATGMRPRSVGGLPSVLAAVVHGKAHP